MVLPQKKWNCICNFEPNLTRNVKKVKWYWQSNDGVCCDLVCLGQIWEVGNVNCSPEAIFAYTCIESPFLVICTDTRQQLVQFKHNVMLVRVCSIFILYFYLLYELKWNFVYKTHLVFFIFKQACFVYTVCVCARQVRSHHLKQEYQLSSLGRA